MANPYFQFKKFTVWHDKCAMKVGTDGCLLGAWVNTLSAKRILDIGTGTGLIALMLAQRQEAQIDAIDIDANACIQAKENISRSPFADRIQVYHSSLGDYAQTEKYDLIVSNPPYFIDSLKCPDLQRNTARHTDTLSLTDLLKSSRKLLAPSGRLALVLPFDQRSTLLAIAHQEQFYATRETWVHSRKGIPPKRLLIEFNQDPLSEPVVSSLTIEIEPRLYSDEFIALLKAYYLKM